MKPKALKLYSRLVEKMQTLVYKLDNSGDTNIVKNGELNFIRSVCKNASEDFVFFDIGGNYGEYTELILRELNTKNYNIHIFEPQKKILEGLKEKFEGNKSIVINDYGLSDKDSSQPIYKNNDGSGLASLYPRDLKHYDIPMNVTEDIKLKTGLEYVKKNKIGHINFMKIDVEGHELFVLRGFGEFLSTKHIDIIQFEYGGANLDSRTSLLDFFNYFQDRGFYLCKIMRKSLLPFKQYDPRFENYVYQNWVAINPKLLK